jgi:DNA-binding transcriptional LysR family regulator
MISAVEFGRGLAQHGRQILARLRQLRIVLQHPVEQQRSTRVTAPAQLAHGTAQLHP